MFDIPYKLTHTEGNMKNNTKNAIRPAFWRHSLFRKCNFLSEMIRPQPLGKTCIIHLHSAVTSCIDRLNERNKRRYVRPVGLRSGKFMGYTGETTTAPPQETTGYPPSGRGPFPSLTEAAQSAPTSHPSQRLGPCSLFSSLNRSHRLLVRATLRGIVTEIQERSKADVHGP